MTTRRGAGATTSRRLRPAAPGIATVSAPHASVADPSAMRIVTSGPSLGRASSDRSSLSVPGVKSAMVKSPCGPGRKRSAPSPPFSVVAGPAAWPGFSAAAGQLLNPALSAFSQGVRGYYFALAAAAWLFGPLWLALGVASSFGLLIYRQEASPAARAIRNARRLLEH